MTKSSLLEKQEGASTTSTSRFHSFDALRALAFLKVFFFHLPISESIFPILFYLKSNGGLGVKFFFVLSGFLITYLLTSEKIKTEKIDLKFFYFKRILRILPLYYMIVFFSYVLKPIGMKLLDLKENFVGYEPDFIFSFLFLENYKMLITDQFPASASLGILWSICIEEHFYLFWPFIIFLIPNKSIPFVTFLFIIVGITSRIFSSNLFDNSLVFNNDIFTSIDNLAIGAMLGFFVATNKSKISSVINSIPSFLKVIYIFIVIIFIEFKSFLIDNTFLNNISDIFFSLLFVLLLIIFIPHDSKIKIKDPNPLNYLGKISYGLYMYHIIVINLLLRVTMKLEIPLDNLSTLLSFTILALTLSILTASLSYKFFEKPLMKLRKFYK